MATRTYLTPDNISDILDVKPRTVYRWIHSGLLQAGKTPGPWGRYLIVEEDFYAFLMKRGEGGTNA